LANDTGLIYLLESIEMDEKHEDMKKQTEEFFKNAFCAKQVDQLLGEKLSDFSEKGIIKITMNDKRKTFYLALLERM